MRTGLVVLLVLALLAPTAPALAWEVTLWGRELSINVDDTFRYAYHGDNDVGGATPADDDDDNYHQIVNSLDLSLGHADLRLGARVDLFLFPQTPFDEHCADDPAAPAAATTPPAWCTRDAGERYVNRAFLERVYFTVARPAFDVTLGDFYASIGRGLALHVVKLQDMGQDTAIRGGKLVVHHRGFGLTFLAGEINPVDLDATTGRLAPWSPEPLLAGRIEQRFVDKLRLGAHAVYLIREDPSTIGSPLPNTDHDLVGGVGLDLQELWDRIDIGGEVNLQRTERRGEVVRGPDSDSAKRGLAAYAQTIVLLGDWTLLGEYKYYNDFELVAPGNIPYELRYHQPPTLERVTAEIEDNTQVSGLRFRVDADLGALGPIELRPFVSYGYFENWSQTDALTIHNPIAGLELDWPSGRATLDGGLRRAATAEQLSHADIHVELDAEQQLWTRHSLAIDGVLLVRDRLGFADTDSWIELDLSISYKWSPHLALGFAYERQGDPALVPEATSYFSATARYYINTSSTVDLRVGQGRPGIKCRNGTCRMFPAFAGAELTMTIRL